MADVTGAKFKEGSSECEVLGSIASPITVGNGTITLTHSLGVTPDVVQVTSVAGYVVYCSAASATTITLGGGNSSATAVVVVKKVMRSGDITETAT